MNQQAISNAPKQNIILDTNILFYLGDKFIKYELSRYLLVLNRMGFGLAISKVSIVELLSGIPRINENGAIDKLNMFINYEIDHNVVIVTAQISTVYKNDKQVETGPIDIADRIIASTAILTGSLVMTADVNHFPRPYFVEKNEKIFSYKEKNNTKIRVIQLLQPNSSLIYNAFSCRS